MLSTLSNLMEKMCPLYGALFFYALLLSITATIGYHYKKREGVNPGLMVGSLISFVLWYQYRRELY